MNLSTALLAMRLMFKDTWRQAIASGIFWLMLGVSLLCTLLCLSAGVQGTRTLQKPDELREFLPRSDPAAADATRLVNQGVEVVSGELTLGFGAIRMPVGRDAEDSVHFLQLFLAGGVADTAGLLLALIWTAGFLPTFLEPSAASVLLAKPVPRWSLLVGKFLGVLGFVGFQALVFVGATWAALGARTGIWSPAYLLCVPFLLVHFAVFFSISALVAVCTRSTVACVLSSILFWLICWGMNFGRHSVVATPELETMSPMFRGIVETAYWVLPKPADMGMILFDALKAGDSFGRLFEFQAVQSQGAYHPELSVLTSLMFTGAVLVAAGRQLVKTDY